MFDINNFSKYKHGRKNKGRESIKLLVLIIMILLLTVTAIRAYTVYERYYFTKENITELNNNMYDIKNDMLRNVIDDGNVEAMNSNKIATNNLQFDLLNKHSKDELNDLLYNNKSNSDIQKTILEASKKYYKSLNTNFDSVLVIGTEKNVLYTDSTTYKQKFKNLHGDKKDITWDYFFDKMENPKLTSETFNKLKFNNTNHQPTIIRIDGSYIYNRVYTVDDLIEIYNKKGVEGLKGFGYLTLSTITEDGDIFGNPDTIFMQQNPASKKIYVYKYADLDEYISKNIETIIEYESTVSKDIIKIEQSNRMDLLISTITIIGNIIVIIGLMFIFKALSEEEDDLIENKNR